MIERNKEGYERAVKDKIIERSPVVDIEIPSIVPHTMMSVDIELEKKLIDIFKNDEMCYPYAVLIDTGLRTSELCGLKWENIDFENKRLSIRQSYQRVDDFEFINGEVVKTGSSVEETTLKSRTSKREVPMSKGVSLHRFRHTFATRLYEAKVKLKNIQALLGHSTVQMTERYLHIDMEEQADSIEQLENYYEKLGISIGTMV